MSTQYELEKRERDIVRAEEESRSHLVEDGRKLTRIRAEIQVLEPRVTELRATYAEFTAKLGVVNGQVDDSVDYLRVLQDDIAKAGERLDELDHIGNELREAQKRQTAKIDQFVAAYEVAAKTEADRRIAEAEKQLKETLAALAQARESKRKVDKDNESARAAGKILKGKV